MGGSFSRCLSGRQRQEVDETEDELVHNLRPPTLVPPDDLGTMAPGAAPEVPFELTERIQTIKQSLLDCNKFLDTKEYSEAQQCLKVANQRYLMAFREYPNDKTLEKLKLEIDSRHHLIADLKCEERILSVQKCIKKCECAIEQQRDFEEIKRLFEAAKVRYDKLVSKYPGFEPLEDLGDEMDVLKTSVEALVPTSSFPPSHSYRPTSAVAAPPKIEPSIPFVPPVLPLDMNDVMLEKVKLLDLAVNECKENGEDVLACIQALEKIDIQKITIPFEIFKILLNALSNAARYYVTNSAKREIKTGIARITRHVAIQMYLLETLVETDKQNLQSLIEGLILELDRQEGGSESLVGKILKKVVVKVRGHVSVVGLSDPAIGLNEIRVDNSFRFELEYLSAIVSLQQQQYDQETQTIKDRLKSVLVSALSLDRSGVTQALWEGLKDAGWWVYAKGTQRFSIVPKLRGLFYVEGIFRSKKPTAFQDIHAFLQKESKEKSSSWEILYQCIDTLLLLTLENVQFQDEFIKILQEYSHNKEWRVREKVIEACILLGIEKKINEKTKEAARQLLFERRLKEIEPRVLLLIQQPDYVKNAKQLLKMAWVHSSEKQEKEAKAQVSLLLSLKEEVGELLIRSQAYSSNETQDYCKTTLQVAQKQEQDLRILLNNTEELTHEIGEVQQWVVQLKSELDGIRTVLNEHSKVLSSIHNNVVIVREGVAQIIEKLDLLGQFKPSLKLPDEATLITYQSLLKKAYSQQTIELMLNQEEVPLDKIYIHLAIVSDHKAQQNKERAALTVLKADAYEEIHTTKQYLRAEDIFKSRNKQAVKRVLLLGRAGVGKTTLCKKFSYDWAMKSLWSEFKYVFQLKFRNITREKYPDPKQHYLQAVIARECFGVLQRDPKDVAQIAADLKYIFENSEENILLLLDGYDESAEMPETIREEILAFPNMLITSRPYNVESVQRKMDMCIENIGFTSAQVEGYIKQFFSRKSTSAEQDDLANGLKTFLKNNPNVQGITHIPINLQMLCFLWELEKGHLEARMSLSDLYHKMVDHIFEGFFEREKIKDDRQKNTLEIIYRKVTAMIALKGMEQSKLILDNPLLWESVNTEVRYFKNGIVDLFKLGFIKPISEKIDSLRKQDGFFIHLSFQEFFAAWHLSQLEEVALGQWLAQYKYHPRYQLLLRFLTKMIYRERGEAGVLKFFELLDSEPRDLVGIAHHLLMVTCLDECENKGELYVNLEKRYHLISRFNDELTNAFMANNQKILGHLSHALKNSVYLINQPSVIQLLETSLQDPARHVGAAYVLGEIGSVYPDHTLHLNSLQKGLQNEHYGARRQALEHLLEVGEHCPHSENLWAWVKTSLKDPNPQIQEASVRVMGAMAMQSDDLKFIKALSSILQKKDTTKKTFHHRVIQAENAAIIEKQHGYDTEEERTKAISKGYGISQKKWQEEQVEQNFHYADNVREQARVALEQILEKVNSIDTLKKILSVLFERAFETMPEDEGAVYFIALSYLETSKDDEPVSLCLLSSLKSPVFKSCIEKLVHTSFSHISKEHTFSFFKNHLVSLRKFIVNHSKNLGEINKESLSPEAIFIVRWIQPETQKRLSQKAEKITKFYEHCAATLLLFMEEPQAAVRSDVIAGLNALRQVYIDTSLVDAVIKISQDKVFKVRSQAIYVLKTLVLDTRLTTEQTHAVQQGLSQCEHEISIAPVTHPPVDDLDPALRPISHTDLKKIITQIEAIQLNAIKDPESAMSLLLDLSYSYPEHHRLEDIIALWEKNRGLAKKRLEDYKVYLMARLETFEARTQSTAETPSGEIAASKNTLMNFDNISNHSVIYPIFRSFKAIEVEVGTEHPGVKKIIKIFSRMGKYQAEKVSRAVDLYISGFSEAQSLSPMMAYLAHPVTEVRQVALHVIDQRLAYAPTIALEEKQTLLKALFSELQNFNTPSIKNADFILTHYHSLWMGEKALEEQILHYTHSHQTNVRQAVYRLLPYTQVLLENVEQGLQQALHSHYRERVSSAFITLQDLWTRLPAQKRQLFMQLIFSKLVDNSNLHQQAFFAHGFIKLVEKQSDCTVLSNAAVNALQRSETISIRAHLWRVAHRLLAKNNLPQVFSMPFEQNEEAIIYQWACWRVYVERGKKLLEPEIKLFVSFWGSNNPLLIQASLQVFKAAIFGEIKDFSSTQKNRSAALLFDNEKNPLTHGSIKAAQFSPYLEQLILPMLVQSEQFFVGYIKILLMELFEYKLPWIKPSYPSLEMKKKSQNGMLLQESTILELGRKRKYGSPPDQDAAYQALIALYKLSPNELIITSFIKEFTCFDEIKKNAALQAVIALYKLSPNELIVTSLINALDPYSSRDAASRALITLFNSDVSGFSTERLIRMLSANEKMTSLVIPELIKRYSLNPQAQALMLADLMVALDSYKSRDSARKVLRSLLNSHPNIEQSVEGWKKDKDEDEDEDIKHKVISELIKRYSLNPQAQASILTGLIKALDHYSVQEAASEALITLCNLDVSGFSTEQLIIMLKRKKEMTSLVIPELIKRYSLNLQDQVSILISLINALDYDHDNAVSQALITLCSADVSGFSTEQLIRMLKGKKEMTALVISELIKRYSLNPQDQESIFIGLIKALDYYSSRDTISQALITLCNADVSGFSTERLIRMLKGNEEMTTLVMPELIKRYSLNPQAQVSIFTGLIKALEHYSFRDAASEALITLCNLDVSGFSIEQLILMLKGNEEMIALVISELIKRYSLNPQGQVSMLTSLIKALHSYDSPPGASQALIALYKLSPNELIITNFIAELNCFDDTRHNAAHQALIALYKLSPNELIIIRFINGLSGDYRGDQRNTASEALITLCNADVSGFRTEQLILMWRGDEEMVSLVVPELIKRYSLNPQNKALILNGLMGALDDSQDAASEALIIFFNSDVSGCSTEQLICMLSANEEMTALVMPELIKRYSLNPQAQALMLTGLINSLHSSTSLDSASQVLIALYKSSPNELIITGIIKRLDKNFEIDRDKIGGRKDDYERRNAASEELLLEFLKNNASSFIPKQLLQILELELKYGRKNSSQFFIEICETDPHCFTVEQLLALSTSSNLSVKEAANQALAKIYVSNVLYRQPAFILLTQFCVSLESMKIFTVSLIKIQGLTETSLSWRNDMVDWFNKILTQTSFIPPVITPEILELNLKFIIIVPQVLELLAHQTATSGIEPQRTQILLSIRYILSIFKRPTEEVDAYLRPTQILNGLLGFQGQRDLIDAAYQKHLKEYLFQRMAEEKMALYRSPSQENLYYSEENQIKKFPNARQFDGMLWQAKSKK